MSVKTKIQWCDSTWNPVTGCTPVSDGCLHCYAKRLAERFPQIHSCAGPDDRPGFNRIVFHPDRLNIPFHWRKSRRIFVCSMGDLFHAKVKPDWIIKILETIRKCPQHIFIFLTKRPENIYRKLYQVTWEYNCLNITWPNLWLGVTVENQEMFDLRWSIVSKIPAAVLFVSGEPLLGNIDFSKYDHKPNWFIVGSETGPGKRPMNLDWVRSLRDQCVAADVPFFYKPGELDGKLWHQWPKEAR